MRSLLALLTMQSSKVSISISSAFLSYYRILGNSPEHRNIYTYNVDPYSNIESFRRSHYCLSTTSTNNESSNQQKTRRKKKNRYEKFSKVTSGEKDPLDLLIEESNAKNLQLHQEKKSNNKKNKYNPTQTIKSSNSEEIEQRERNKMTFPNLSTINPYDPTTYGFVELGTLLGAHGIKGQIKLKSSTAFGSIRLCPPKPSKRYLKMPNRKSPREIQLLHGRKIESANRGNDLYLLSIENVESRQEAMSLRGAILYARMEQRDEIADDDEDAFFIEDLVNLEVFLTSEDKNQEDNLPCIGTVNGIVFTEDISDLPQLGYDYLEIALKLDDEGYHHEPVLVLIPFVPQLVPIVDVTQRYILIDPPEGLLDLTYQRMKKIVVKGLLPPAKD